jgi:hypothetical protein
VCVCVRGKRIGWWCCGVCAGGGRTKRRERELQVYNIKTTLITLITLITLTTLTTLTTVLLNLKRNARARVCVVE